VTSARRAGLRVAPQGTGHNPRPLGALGDVVLLRTAAMQGVTVDPATRTARVEAGVLWQDAVEAAAEYDLAALHGSSPDVGVVGYSLGGGIVLVRTPARDAGQPRVRGRSWSRPTVTRFGQPLTTSRTCSGRCAAAEAGTSAS
jgi:hypothetical protein